MTNNARLIALDAVRGFAAIAIVLLHVGLETGPRSLAPYGYLAVDLFFIMSGFVISRAYDDKLLAGMRWRQFMLLRVARLYPSMFLGLLVGLLAYFIVPPSAYPVGLVPGGAYRLGWYSTGHFLLIPDLTAREGIFPLNSVFWSLFFELVMNAIHGLVLRRLTNVRLGALTVVMAIVWARIALTSGPWGWSGGWDGATFLAGFARIGWAYSAGVLLRRVADHRWKVPAIVPLTLAAIVLLVPDLGAVTPRIVMTLFLILPAAVVLAAGAHIPAAARGVARWLGAISYPLYATHQPLLLIIFTRFNVTDRARVIAVVAAILMATIAEYAYDAPLRARLTAWVNRLDTRASASTQKAVVSS
jgi:peptidoglycan/LPS O-acetylase OafA/YrhL